MMLLRAFQLALAALLLGTTAFVVAVRLVYPFELEWMEGATVIHVARLLAGQQLYVRPSLEFVPFAYPPLYYYACVPLAWLLGVGFLPLRIVSVTATAVTLAAIFAVVRRSSGTVSAIVACAAFAGAYAASDGWLDLGRVDALYIAMLALLYWAVIRARTERQWAVAGGLAFLAFMTKQPALAAIAPLAVYALIFERRAGWSFCLTLVALTVIAVATLNLWTDGWYAYYVLHLPGLRLRISQDASRALSFWTADMLPFAIALGMGFGVVIMRREWRHAALASGFILSAWISRLEGGAWNNTVLPAYLGLSILLGISLRNDGRGVRARAALAAAQLLILVYDPRPFVPTPQHRADGAALLQALRSMPPPVLVLEHAYWPTQAGLPEFAHGWAVIDVIWPDRGPVGTQLEADITKAINDHRFSAIVLDDEQNWFFRTIAANYDSRRELRAPLPLSGAPRQARYVYERSARTSD